MEKHMNMSCLGYPVYTGRLKKIVPGDKTIIGTINKEKYCLAEKDWDFKQKLISADILLPVDGKMVLAANLLEGKRIKRVAADDLHDMLLSQLSIKGGSCFFINSSRDVLNHLKTRVLWEHPNVRVGTYVVSPEEELTREVNDRIIQAVNDFAPDVLFVGLPSPLQEKWTHANKSNLNTNLICALGQELFTSYARVSKGSQKAGKTKSQEWMAPSLTHPNHMHKRHISSGLMFGYFVTRNKYRQILAKLPQLSSATAQG